MSLLKYLEYLTRDEQAKAFQAGQTNLDPKLREDKSIKPPVVKKPPRWVYKTSEGDDLAEWFVPKKEEKRAFKKNVKPRANGTRMVLLANGDYYTVDQDSQAENGLEPIHYSILAYIVKNFLYPITQKEYQRWYFADAAGTPGPKNFICLIWDANDRRLYLAESYNYSSGDWSPTMLKKWSNIAKKAGLGEVRFMSNWNL